MKLARAILRALTKTIYRIHITGAAHIPKTGPGLLVANHLSLADGFLVGASVQRPVRFLVWRAYYEDRRFHWWLKRVGAIPISEKDPPKEILRSLLEARKALEAGDLVCLFAEGQISRTGNLLEFKRGFEVMIKDTDVPVIPVNLDRVWGSIFSFEHGKVIFKRPRQIPYPITVSFGAPLPRPVTPATVRQAVLDLSADAFQLRLEGLHSLATEFIKRAKAQPRRLAVADTLGREMSYGRLAGASAVLAQILAPLCKDDENVGILLPSSVAGVLANVAISFLGKVAVNLNYTTGQRTLELCVQRAGIKRIVTTRKLLAKTQLPEMPGMLFIEDLAAQLSKFRVLRAQLSLSFFSARGWIRRWAPNADKPLSDTATILFSSGSTGVPKGVLLSHTNILANVVALSQVFDVGPSDRMVGILPFFHSFGFTATLWFPIIAGFSAVYHSNPLEAKMVGDLSEKYNATLLLATPTFLSAYIRKCTPEQFAHMRYVITGAEHLRDALREAFEQKFGKTPLPGFGCTELSPVVAVNLPDVTMGEIKQIGHKIGKVGQPIPGVSIRIVDPNTFAPMPVGERGLLLVKGQNVMKGYLGDEAKTREAMHEGWYITGDIATVDDDGFLEIVDRLSRFSKIGGEMVPHILIEEKLQDLSGASDPVFAVTAVPDERKGEQIVVLYVDSVGINTDTLIEKLKASGVPNLWIPSKENFFAIAALPVLGTGKLDLAKLKATAVELTQR